MKVQGAHDGAAIEKAGLKLRTAVSLVLKHEHRPTRIGELNFAEMQAIARDQIRLRVRSSATRAHSSSAAISRSTTTPRRSIWGPLERGQGTQPPAISRFMTIAVAAR